MPIAAALLAGALATLNPCGFMLLPAFLAYTVGAEDPSPPPTATRLLRGVLAGLLVTLGGLVVFAVAGLPLSLGATQLATAMPWVGLVLGLAMVVAAVATLANRQLPLAVRRSATAPGGQGARAMLLFGAGYGLSSVSCTLPVFLIVVGASLSSGSVPATLVAFGAYAVGMALLLMALSIGAALLRDGLEWTLRRALPHLRWVHLPGPAMGRHRRWEVAAAVGGRRGRAGRAGQHVAVEQAPCHPSRQWSPRTGVPRRHRAHRVHDLVVATQAS